MPAETLYERTETRSRRSVGSYLGRIADAFRRDDPVPVDENDSVTVDPPAETEMEVEVERNNDAVSVEFEIGWAGDQDDLETDADASMATFELYQDRADEWRWRLRHDNGNIVADSGEGYTSKQSALQGIDSVRTNAPGAAIDERET